MTHGIARRHSGKLVILLLAIAFLGHDVLMAGNAHAQPDATAGDAHASHGHTAMPDSTPEAGHHAIASQLGTDQDSGIDTCSTMRQLVQRPGNYVQLDAAPPAICAMLPARAEQLAVDEWWREPAAPPDVIRAMFQVFLI